MAGSPAWAMIAGALLCGSCLVGIDDVASGSGGASGAAASAGASGIAGAPPGGGTSGDGSAGAGAAGTSAASGEAGVSGAAGSAGAANVRVQHGSATLDPGSDVAAGAIEPIALDRAVLFFGKRHAELAPIAYHVRGELTGAHVEFTRATTSGSVEIDWHVLEYSALRVQRGTLTTVGTEGIATLAQPVDLSKTFAFASQSHEGSYFGDDDLWALDLPDPSTLRLRASDTESSDVAWQVVELLDASRVFSGIVTLPYTGNSAVATLPQSVDLTRSFVIFSYQLSGILLSMAPERCAVRGRLAASDAVTFDRTTPGDVSFQISWFVVELGAGKVHTESLSLTAGMLQIEQPLPALDVTRSIPFASWLGMAGKAASTTQGALGEAQLGYTLPSGSTLVARRGSAEATAEIEAYVLEL